MHKYFFTILLLLTMPVFADETPSDTNKKPIYVANNYNQTHIKVTQELAAELSATLSVAISNVLENISLKITEIKERAQNTITAPFHWVIENKWKSIFMALIGIYSYHNYSLLTLKKELSKPDCWSLWNKAMNLEELFACPQNHLGTLMIREAQRRYTSRENPGDFISPLATCMHIMDEEKTKLEHYSALCKWVETLRIARIMWHDNEFAEECNERLNRLAYLKSVFVNWLTDYKFTQTVGTPA